MAATLPTRREGEIVERFPGQPRPKKFSVLIRQAELRPAESDLATADTHNSIEKHADGLLTSWKDISAYLNRGIRTVQRWEYSLKLPVHRIGVGSRAPVFAFRCEINRWLQENDATSRIHSLRRVSRGRERLNLNPLQRQLMRLAREFRKGALELERAVVANDGLEPDVHIAHALLTAHKLLTELEESGKRYRIGFSTMPGDKVSP